MSLIYILGKYETEVTGTIARDKYISGSLFLEPEPEPARPVTCPRPGLNKPFVSHAANGMMPKTAPPVVVAKPSEPVDPSSIVYDDGKSQIVMPTFLSSVMREHQVAGVKFMLNCLLDKSPGCILADEMGLGKTLQAIAAIWLLISSNKVNKCLVITPSSLVENWSKEFRKWLRRERLDPLVANGNAGERNDVVNTFIMSQKYRVLILSYDVFRLSHDALSECQAIDMLVCDEGHRLKNAGVKTFTMLTSMRAKKRLVLTGTPVQNDLEEFYTISNFVVPGRLGSRDSFMLLFDRPISKLTDPTCSANDRELGNARAQELRSHVDKFLLRRTSDILTKFLPPMHEYIVFVKPTPLQACMYQAVLHTSIVRNMINCHSATVGTAALECMMLLRKICNCITLVYDEDGDIHSDLLSDYEAPECVDFKQVQPQLTGKLLTLQVLLNNIIKDTNVRI